ncbi:hypothetical protein E5676_scaffold451G001300 [Cucumis melo var. makuwa]|uniref:Uncharacterized protein n=1 Tax=Cucumis melo var. makuwa TaxID=1194695 RepID=A0A5D3BTK7_CUCMM|nr:hypothetical protein E5676_scaffold451G001300 [Cucumis melo var. makuwa]
MRSIGGLQGNMGEGMKETRELIKYSLRGIGKLANENPFSLIEAIIERKMPPSFFTDVIFIERIDFPSLSPMVVLDKCHGSPQMPLISCD